MSQVVYTVCFSFLLKPTSLPTHTLTHTCMSTQSPILWECIFNPDCLCIFWGVKGPNVNQVNNSQSLKLFRCNLRMNGGGRPNGVTRWNKVVLLIPAYCFELTAQSKEKQVGQREKAISLLGPSSFHKVGFLAGSVQQYDTLHALNITPLPSF